MNLVPQMAKIRVDNQNGVIFNTGPYGDPTLRIKIFEISFVHAREDQKIGLVPNFNELMSSNG